MGLLEERGIIYAGLVINVAVINVMGVARWRSESKESGRDLRDLAAHLRDRPREKFQPIARQTGWRSSGSERWPV